MKENKAIEEIVTDKILADTIAWGHDYANEQDKNIRVLIPEDFGIKSRLGFKINKLSGQQMVHIYDKENDDQMVRIGKSDGAYFELKPREVINTSESGLAVVNKLEAGALMIEYGIDGGEIAGVLNEIETKAKEMGLIDEKGNKKRPEEISIIIPQKYKVEEAFNNVGTVFPLLGKDPEEVMSMFDKPEELMVSEDPYTGIAIGLAKKSDFEYLERRKKIVNDVLLENGVQMEELLILMDKDEKIAMPLFMKIRQEIDKRMEQG